MINVSAKTNIIDYRLHQGYLMVYAATTGVIICWKPDKPFVIHRAHHVWFDEYIIIASP